VGGKGQILDEGWRLEKGWRGWMERKRRKIGFEMKRSQVGP